MFFREKEGEFLHDLYGKEGDFLHVFTLKRRRKT